MSENYLRELLESVLSGQRTLDEVRADLYDFDRERMKEEDVRWWVWCKDHSSSYPTEERALIVRQSIERLTFDRPNLGCHNTHLIVQSATDPRKGLVITSSGAWMTKDDMELYGGLAQDDPAEGTYPDDPPEQLCWWCDMPLGVHVTPIRVWQADVGWGSVFIHSTSDKPECWQEWRKASGYGTGVDVTPPQPTEVTDEVKEFVPSLHYRVGTCVQCGHLICTSADDPTRWWDLAADGHKRYTCHPSDTVAHSEHRIDTPLRTTTGGGDG